MDLDESKRPRDEAESPVQGALESLVEQLGQETDKEPGPGGGAGGGDPGGLGRGGEGARGASGTSGGAPRSGLADRLLALGRHPVIIFGSRVSGKSTFLMSLVQCANNSERVSLKPGESVLDRTNPRYASVNDAADQFLKRDALAFGMGKSVPRTEFTQPFFIPVDIQRTDATIPTKIAFLEGRGELYEADIAGNSPRPQPELPEEVKDILRRYPESITIIYVAPFCRGGPNEESRISDASLDGLMSAYLEHRDAKAHDNHLFLLTMWDLHARPMADDPAFSAVESATVDEVVERLYRQAWMRFCSMPLDAKYRRFYMQYSSGFIVDDVVEIPPKRHRDTFDRYPRTVWNWIYGNAVAAGAGPSRGAKPLFQEVPRAGRGRLAGLLRLR